MTEPIRNQGTLEETAHHEAGHQVAARVLGAPELPDVSIVRNEAENSRGRCAPLRWPEDEDDPLAGDERHDRADIIIDLAGPAAAKKFTGRCNPVGAADDVQWAQRRTLTVRENQDSLLTGSWTFAEELIGENWAAVVALATALLQNKELTGPEAEQVIDAVLEKERTLDCRENNQDDG